MRKSNCTLCDAVTVEGDHLNCDKCKNKYHWKCALLSDTEIKQHKTNPYKPWRCDACMTKYCKKCTKKFSNEFNDNNRLIDCDKCENWYHQSCTNLTNDEYNHFCTDPLSVWNCTPCTAKYCAKCGITTRYTKGKSSCQLCNKVFHHKCAGIKNMSSKPKDNTWTCRDCNSLIFPFFTIDNTKLKNLATINNNHTPESIKTKDSYNKCCTVCEKPVTRLGLPCSSCKSLIHSKCSNITDVKNNFHHFKGKWECPACHNHKYPFTQIDNKTLIDDIPFNSNLDNTSRFKPEINIDEKLKLVLSYAQKTSWHSYTHASEKENFSNDDDIFENYKPDFEYYGIDTFRKQKNTWKNEFGVFHTNICSLQANIENLEDLLSDLQYEFNVIALTETWNPEKSKDRFTAKQIQGYHEYYGVTGSSSKGGCGFYVKENLSPIPRTDLNFKISETGQETESCWIELVNTKGANTIIGTIYRHPSKNNTLFFYNLKQKLKKINREKKKIILCGDFNLDLLNFDKDEQVNEFLNIIIEQNMHPCITEPTRITNTNKPSLVDNIFVNTFEQPTSGNILEHISYDHLPNFTILDHQVHEKKIEQKKRDRRNFDHNIFEEELLEPDFTLKILNANDTDEAYDMYQNKFIELLDKHAPMRKLTKKEINLRKKPWLTSGLLTSIRRKRKLFNKLKEEKFNNKNTSETYQKYKTHRDRINSLKRLSKRNFYQKFFTTNYNNSKKVWRGINQLLNKYKGKQKSIFLEDNGLITDSKEVANRFNNYFVNIAEKLSDKIINKNTKFQDYLKNPNMSRLFLNETTPDEIVKIINTLDPKKSGDIYSISPEYVISAKQAVAHHLTIIFNRSIREGCFPQAMKTAKIIPLHKGNSVLSVSNYRPISLLPIFSKIFERLVYNRLIDFINENKILSQNQFGFQKGKSTENAVTSIISQIINARDRKESAYCIFLDFAKAFDTVNHDILIEKLNYYGIKDNVLSWFNSYLRNRAQYTQIGETLSDVGYIKHGVPQGSVLGPLLFLLYINDITESSEILQFFLFADDTTIFYSDKTTPETESLLNLELSKVADWLAANKLSLNVGKSNFLHFHHGNCKKEPLNIKIDGTPVEEKNTTKYLGVILDNKLNWKAQIQVIKTKLSKATGMIAKARHYVTKPVLLNLYYAFFQSHINYNLLNWSSAKITILQTITMNVKNIIRIMSFKNKYEHTLPLFKAFDILPFDLQIRHKKAMFMWKVSNNLVQPPLSNLFTKNEHNPTKFILPRAPKDYNQRALSYSGIKIWNTELNESLRNITSLKLFNAKYKKHLMDTLT